jgi:demethylmenaquinone methyltransferase/2-methoxy-6-polyprenyl-1,4-benzoquinol methylase
MKLDQKVPAGEAPGKGAMVRELFSRVAHRYDFANHLLSGGLDFLWRKAVVQMVKPWKPARILDVAAGSGDLSLALQKAFPLAEVIATDFCAPMLDRAGEKGVQNRVLADAMDLPFPDDSFDLVTVAFGLRNMESWERALREMRRVIRPGGHLLILDFSTPIAPVLPFYRWYLHRILPTIAGWVTGAADAYAYLGDSIESFPSGKEMVRRIEGEQFRDTGHRPLSLGIATIYRGTKDGSPLIQDAAEPQKLDE